MSTLKDFYYAEIIRDSGRSFSWWSVLNRMRRSRRCNYLFWFRMAYVLHDSPSSMKRSIAKSINNWMIKRHNIEIMLGVKIDEGLNVGHNVGIVITCKAIIGKNFLILQNTTIGSDGKSDAPINIGDNVSLGANTCIIGSGLSIGDNVEVGAMSFINKSIPADHIYITEKTSYYKLKAKAP
ncbi:succinyltransferase-like protein [Sinobacterium caligoides]|uniref:Serine acetyltransferase n=1 Tax=Sinobacterium caligoides TaxID=933926 RepID=A0A3N2DGG0_9GAMM|nr:serine acetyltransferase [Sinobacterium caligoides]ROR98821.1 succinyltransferase-like protein [Sinobacterium caligoides]